MHKNSMDKKRLVKIMEKYSLHPEFLGIEISDVNQRGAVDDTMLHIAARTGAVDEILLLVLCGATIDVAGDLGNTPLHQAAMMGQVAAVEQLLELNARSSIRNEFGQTAAEVAYLGGFDQLAITLRKHAE